MPKSKKPRNKKYKGSTVKKKSNINIHKAFKKLNSDIHLRDEMIRVEKMLLTKHKSLESQVNNIDMLIDKIDNAPLLADGTIDTDKLQDYIENFTPQNVVDSPQDNDLDADLKRIENAIKANSRRSKLESHETSEILNYQYLLNQLNQIDRNLQIVCDHFDVNENYQLFMESIVEIRGEIDEVCVKAFGSTKAAAKIIESVTFYLEWMDKDSYVIFSTLTNNSIAKFYLQLCNQLYTSIAFTYNQHLLLALEIQNKQEIAFALFAGESSFDSSMLGNDRLKEIFLWASKNVPEQQLLIIDYESVQYLELIDLKNLYLKNSKEGEERIPWLCSLTKLIPFSHDSNKRELEEFIEICKKSYNDQIGCIKRIDSVLKRAAICVTWIHNFNFPFAKKAKSFFQNQPDEKAFAKSSMNSSELLYLKNSLIPRYMEIVKDLKTFGTFNDSAAPYALPMVKATLAICKTIIDSLHRVKKSNDLELQTLTDQVKSSLLAMYDEISQLYKKVNKEEHHWISELCRIVEDISTSIAGLNSKDKADVLNFNKQIKLFLNDYRETYKLHSSEKVLKDIQYCIHRVDGIITKLPVHHKTYKI